MTKYKGALLTVAAVTVAATGSLIPTKASAQGGEPCGRDFHRIAIDNTDNVSVRIYCKGNHFCALAYRIKAAKGVEGPTRVAIHYGGGINDSVSERVPDFAGPARITVDHGCFEAVGDVKIPGASGSSWAKAVWCFRA